MADVTPSTDPTPAEAKAKAGKAAPKATPRATAAKRVRPNMARRPVPSIAPAAARLAAPAAPADNRAAALAPLRDVGPVSHYLASVAKAQVDFVLELSRIQLSLARDVARVASPTAR